MLDTINIIKGVHPGIILDRELKKRNLPSSRFAMSIDEYPQTISAIINQRRGMNPKIISQDRVCSRNRRRLFYGSTSFL